MDIFVSLFISKVTEDDNSRPPLSPIYTRNNVQHTMYYGALNSSPGQKSRFWNESEQCDPYRQQLIALGFQKDKDVIKKEVSSDKRRSSRTFSVIDFEARSSLNIKRYAFQ